MGIVLIIIFFGIAGAIPGIAPNQAAEMTGVAGSALQMTVGVGSQALIDLLMLFFVMRYRKCLYTASGAAISVVGLAGWAILSICWSQSRWLTVRHALPFALATAFAICLGGGATPPRVMRLLLVAFGFMALWSTVLAIGFPAIGLDASSGHTHDWQGAFSQKNACGRSMVFALATLIPAELCDRHKLLLFGLFGMVLVWSGSRGAWIIAGGLLAAALFMGVLFKLERRLRLVCCSGGLLLFALFIAVAMSNFGALAELLGRDVTLTGRTQIWHQVWLAILQRPITGYGFSAFWQGMQGASWEIVVALGFVLFHAHNGFLEIWLELGMVGLAIFIVSLFRGVYLVGVLVQRGSFAAVVWPCSVLLLTILYDIEENTILSYNGLYWLLYVIALVQMESAVQALYLPNEVAETASPRPSDPTASLVGAAGGPWL
jgi:exopolysaccharide production protein ExoQ